MKTIVMLSALVVSSVSQAWTISPFSCVGASNVPVHETSTYHFEYSSNGKGKIFETKDNGLTVISDNMECGFDIVPPPPGRRGGGVYVPKLSGITCRSWSQQGPQTGFMAEIHLDSGNANGFVRFCVDDNCPSTAIMPDSSMTNLGCQMPTITQ